MKKHSNVILIVLGLIIISSVIICNIYSSNSEEKMLAEYEKSLKLNAMQSLEKANANAGKSGELQDDVIDKLPQKDSSQKNVLSEIDLSMEIGILSIPKIELKSLIREGSEEKTIKSSLGHVETTAYPGEKGNFAVAGHRNYSRGRFFNRLNEVEIGDYVYVETAKDKYTYEVTEIKVVESDDVSVLEPTKDAVITMITCTPAHVYIGTKRLIVRGKLIEKNQLE